MGQSFGHNTAMSTIRPDPIPTRLRATNGAVVQDIADIGAAAILDAMRADSGRFEITGGMIIDQDARTILTQSSGSTGAPKVIRRSHASWTASFAQNARLFQIGAGTRVAIAGALAHSLTTYALCETLALGGVAVMLGDRMSRDRLRALTGASVLYATPTFLRLIAAMAPPLPDLRHVVTGGGILTGGERAALAAIAPDAQVHEFFGAAETSFVTLSTPDTPTGSVGRAYPAVQITIADGDTPLPAGQIGAIWVDGPYLFDGYDSGGDSQTRRGPMGVSIGEMGHLDADGFLYLAGRAARMVTVGDVNVFPERVEGALRAITGVTDAAVVAVPDRLRGHRLIAWVEGAGDPDVVRDALRGALPPAFVPARIHVTDALPRLPAGKADLQTLTAMARGDV
jgi:long-chain acyl-CoA synthetase